MRGALNAYADGGQVADQPAYNGSAAPPTNAASPLSNPLYFSGVDPTMQALMFLPPGPESPYAKKMFDASDALMGDPADTAGALSGNRNKYDAAVQAKMAAIQRAAQRLSSTQADWTTNTPALAAAAGLLGKNRGGIGGRIGDMFSASIPAIENQRALQLKLAGALGDLDISGGDTGIEGAKGDEGFLEKRFDLADKFANQAAQTQGRADLAAARKYAADRQYQGKVATSQNAPLGASSGLYGMLPNDFASKMVGIENTSGDPAAKNPYSSATGDGQFINSTWLPLIKASRPDLAAKMNDQQLLALRSDPSISRQMIVELGKHNAQALDAAGLPTNMTTLALAHRFGPDTAATLINANHDAPMASLLSDDVMKANPQLAHQTVGAYVDNLESKVGSDPVSMENGTLSFNTSGDEFLKSLAPSIATQVKALADGRMAFPTGYQLTKPYWQNMLQAVSQYDPTFDAVNYNSRNATRKDFTSGKSAQNITSFNTAIGHLDSLDKSIDSLNNTNVPAWNAIANSVSTNVGDTRYQAAAKNFAAAKNAVVDELTRAFRGSGGNVHDIEGWEKTLDTADSPVALHQAVQQAVELLKSRIDAVGEQYKKGMGTTADHVQLLTPKAREALARLVPDEAGGQGAPQFQEGQVLHQNGNTFKVINGTPVFQHQGQ